MNRNDDYLVLLIRIYIVMLYPEKSQRIRLPVRTVIVPFISIAIGGMQSIVFIEYSVDFIGIILIQQFSFRYPDCQSCGDDALEPLLIAWGRNAVIAALTFFKSLTSQNARRISIRPSAPIF